MKVKRKSDLNLGVIENFILFFTHTSNPKDGYDANYEVPQTFTPKVIYELAEAYIEEDHVDGRDNHEDHIVTYTVESSFVTEDPDKEHKEYVVIVADFGDEVGTQTVATFEDISNLQAVKDFIKLIKCPLPQ